MIKQFAVAGLAAALSMGMASSALAEWPEKPIKVIVPFKAGGTSDQVTRAFQVAIQESEILPQPLTVVNVGGHFSIGARQVMEANPDGYTFLTLHIALMGGEAAGLFPFGYRDFTPVATTGEFCVLPVVRKDSGIDSVEQLLEKAKDEPDTLIFGANLGAINHMGGIQLENLVDGAKFRFVQIGGGTANFTALMGGQTDASVLSAAEVANFTLNPDGTELSDAQIKPLAYTGPERLESLPDVPTLQELGYDMNYCIQSWWFAPKGTPQEAIDGLAQALEDASGTDRVAKFYKDKMFGSVFLKGDEMAASLDETWDRIEPVAKQAAQK
ncbi:tripartite tricarboxylate transporter substrate binding protein [Acuticoccus sp. M5D2P5]|uniref:Bug family tripartite tricarboxylate transporter substrate binding protein n=1 Tax=Acuticoccus kalidii TaxID=2910977 RepID=UPI001F16377A|nr:tripartite tricarboxylate transporter substrate binding protein [Acuticoccus kalidii]MCF3936678.1 tripartite tricarboxylate transporter substrate binding protein [Acuticoccus kalidii]